MKTVCAWCDDVITDGDPDGPISHGICPECAIKAGLSASFFAVRRARQAWEDYYTGDDVQLSLREIA